MTAKINSAGITEGIKKILEGKKQRKFKETIEL